MTAKRFNTLRAAIWACSIAPISRRVLLTSELVWGD
jgi:hypothetical protein